jgi:predicted nicotinamide N-methyase
VSDDAGAALLGMAVEHSVRDVPVAASEEQVGVVRARLVGRSFEFVDDVAVLEAGALAGLVPIERLLAARRRPRSPG